MEPEARQMLISYDWPGNIRQVQNVIHRMLVLADGEKIGVADLPSQITKASAGDGGSQSGSTSLDSLREQTLRFEVRVIQQAIENAGGDRQVAAQKLGIGVSTLYRKLEEHEKLAAT
jgi:two-component system response regulator AtoC